jgi:hypothetical protein
VQRMNIGQLSQLFVESPRGDPAGAQAKLERTQYDSDWEIPLKNSRSRLTFLERRYRRLHNGFNQAQRSPTSKPPEKIRNSTRKMSANEPQEQSSEEWSASPLNTDYTENGSDSDDKCEQSAPRPARKIPNDSSSGCKRKRSEVYVKSIASDPPKVIQFAMEDARVMAKRGVKGATEQLQLLKKRRRNTGSPIKPKEHSHPKSNEVRRGRKGTVKSVQTPSKVILAMHQPKVMSQKGTKKGAKNVFMSIYNEKLTTAEGSNFARVKSMMDDNAVNCWIGILKLRNKLEGFDTVAILNSQFSAKVAAIQEDGDAFFVKWLRNVVFLNRTKTIIIPHNIPGSHWVAVIVSVEAGTIVAVESLNANRENVLQTYKSLFEKHWLKIFGQAAPDFKLGTIRPPISPDQRDSYSCGAVMCNVIDLACQGVRVEAMKQYVNAENVRALRKEMHSFMHNFNYRCGFDLFWLD